MYRFFDNHGKKVLAIAAAFLMVAFLLPTTGLRGCDGPSNPTGMVNGKAVNLGDVASAEAHLEAAGSLEQQTPFSPIPIAVPATILGPRLYASLQREPVTFYLLLREAQEAGVAISPADVLDALQKADPVYVRDRSDRTQDLQFSKINPAVQEQLAVSVAAVQAVAENFSRSVSSLKVSEPMIDRLLAQQLQQVRARLIPLDAANYLDQVGPLSQEQLQPQFEAFKNTREGAVDPANNPFGFGYLVPNRVRIQYIAVPADEVRQAVLKRKSDAEWEEDARLYYIRNKDQYTPEPETSATTQSATQPTTQPGPKPFEEVRDQVYNDLREPLFEQQQSAIVNRIVQQLNADYQRSAKGAPTTQAIADSKLGDVAFGSTEYLLKLRDDIQQQFGITLRVVNQNELLSEDQLRKLPGIGESMLRERTARGDQVIGAASYLIESAKPLVGPEDAPLGGILDLYQPTKPLVREGQATYIARIVQADASHAPETLDMVRAQVERDLRRKLAFDKAVQAAESAVGQLKAGSAAEAIETPFFSMQRGPIPGLPETMDGFSARLVEPVFGMLAGLSDRAALPVEKVIPLQTLDKVVAAQLFDIRTTLSPDQLAARREMAREMLREDLISFGIAQSWFDPDTVAKRVGYVPPEQAAAPEVPAPPPRSPLMP